MNRRARHRVVLALWAVVASTAPAGAWASDTEPGATPAEAQVATTSTRSAQTGAPTITLFGHGNGHGIGLSQWGALGYAIDDGWSAAQILDHYYGGTVAGVASAGDLSVRLMTLDGAQTSVVQPNGAAVLVGDPAARQWRSLVARETAAGAYRVWGHPSLTMCPAAEIPLDDPISGWVVVADGVASPVFSTATDTTTSERPDDLLAVCEPAGTVRAYRGRIRAANGSEGENRTVNDVPLEQYLRSVVPSEVPAEWAARGNGQGFQALLAQAVAARSYALVQTRYTYARTCDTQACQVYAGAAKRAGLTATWTRNEKPETDMAIAGTAGLVRRVGSEGGPVANTMFSSSSGGWTAPSSSPGFPPVRDDGDDVAGNGYHDWSRTIEVAAIERAWPQIGRFTSLTVTKRNGLGADGGRVLAAVVAGDAGQVTVTGDDVRKAFALPSNWFSTSSACSGRDAPPVVGSASPSPGLGFAGITPTRVVDTRTGVGTAAAPLLAGCTLSVPFVRPAGATAVAVTLTVTGAAADGFTTAYPCGTPRPNVSAVQIVARSDVPGTTVVPLGSDGMICVYTSVTADVVVDVLGWFGPAGPAYPGQLGLRAPSRVLDTRRSAAAPLPAGSITRVPAATGQTGGVAVSANITATGARSAGYVTAFPCSQGQPVASVVNFRPGVDSSNHALVTLDGAGEWCLFNSAATHLVVDVDGAFAPGTTLGTLTVVAPQRVIDSRSSLGSAGAWRAGETRALDLGDTAGAGVWFEITAVDPAAAGYLTVYPCDELPQETSVLNAPARTNVANLVVVSTDPAGHVCVLSSMPTHVLIDVIGRVTPT